MNMLKSIFVILSFKIPLFFIFIYLFINKSKHVVKTIGFLKSRSMQNLRLKEEASNSTQNKQQR